MAENFQRDDSDTMLGLEKINDLTVNPNGDSLAVI